ncbi:MAG TPA: hypothetical protein VF173_07330 [Thermoanaerobaculia bacterium]|nr:hypothetical protein [Thermoanaerobaculia bacterium]
MPEYISWGLVALSALILWFAYRLLRLHLHLRNRWAQREMLYKERLSAIKAEQPLPEGAEESESRVSLPIRLATAPGVKIASFVGLVLLFSGAGVWAAFGFLPERYVLHDFWSLGLICVALGVGLLIYALCSTALTKAVIAEKKLS